MTYPGYPFNNPADQAEPSPYPVPPVNTPKKRSWIARRGALLITAGVAFSLGILTGVGAAHGSGNDANLAAPAPEVTITQAAPGPTVTVNAVAPAVKPTVAPKPKPVKASIADGEQVTVGADVPAGRYSARSTDNTCYWEIDKSGSNGQDIVANDLGKTGHITVTLKKGEDFSSQSCGDWTQQ